jgi:hypothetical protein
MNVPAIPKAYSAENITFHSVTKTVKVKSCFFAVFITCQVQAGSLSPPRGSRFMSAVRRTSSAGEVPGTSHRAWLARGMLRNSQSMTSMTSLLSPPLTSCDGLYISLAPTQQGERYACAGAQVHVCGSTRASAVLTHCRLCRRVSEAFALSTEVRETR